MNTLLEAIKDLNESDKKEWSIENDFKRFDTLKRLKAKRTLTKREKEEFVRLYNTYRYNDGKPDLEVDDL